VYAFKVRWNILLWVCKECLHGWNCAKITKINYDLTVTQSLLKVSCHFLYGLWLTILSNCPDTFHRQLKTHYFQQAFSSI